MKSEFTHLTATIKKTKIANLIPVLKALYPTTKIQRKDNTELSSEKWDLRFVYQGRWSTSGRLSYGNIQFVSEWDLFCKLGRSFESSPAVNESLESIQLCVWLGIVWWRGFWLVIIEQIIYLDTMNLHKWRFW